ncbi:MAG: iron-containing alcohol dehydrogenase, partial [Candidatus Omnitrophica bacterium]|nr:iron-containing alcohol dehydrogenase [Candidatus Omnitrophota bacterium]
MKKVNLDLGKRSYQILIGDGILSSLAPTLNKLNLGKVAVIVTNPTIKRLYGSTLARALRGANCEVKFIQVPDSEQSKSFKHCFNLVGQFADLDRGRGIFALAFGGGVIGDLTGFAAAIYRRG